MRCISFPVVCMRVPVAPYPHLLFSVSYAPGCVRRSPVALICFSLMTNPLKHPLMCLLAIPLHIFFGEMSVKTFANICKYLQIFSVCGLPFHLLNNVIWRRKVLCFREVWFIDFIFLLYLCILCCIFFHIGHAFSGVFYFIFCQIQGH